MEESDALLQGDGLQNRTAHGSTWQPCRHRSDQNACRTTSTDNKPRGYDFPAKQALCDVVRQCVPQHPPPPTSKHLPLLLLLLLLLLMVMVMVIMGVGMALLLKTTGRRLERTLLGRLLPW